MTLNTAVVMVQVMESDDRECHLLKLGIIFSYILSIGRLLKRVLTYW